MKDEQLQASSESTLRTLLIFLVCLVFSRALILTAIYHLTHGHELSNDVAMHMRMVRSPLGILDNTLPKQEYPPLLPVLEALFGYPLSRVLPDFLTIRITMILWETVLGVLFFYFLRALGVRGTRRAVCLLAFVVLPAGWLTTTVMAQDDAIAACGFLLPLFLLVTGRQVAALFASGFGLIAAKIFVGLELVGLLPMVDRRNRIKAMAAGLLPVAVVYGGMTVHRVLHSLPLPLLSFKPNPYFGTNFWLVLHRYENLNLSAIGTYTGFLALACSFIPIVLLLRIPRPRWTPHLISVACAAMLLIFFSLFYHVEPEYFLIVLPLLIATAEGAADVCWYSLIAIVPWFGKFFQNATFMSDAARTSGKVVSNDLFHRFFHSSPEKWLTADQLIFSVLTLYVSWRWSAKLWTPSAQPAFVEGRSAHVNA